MFACRCEQTDQQWMSEEPVLKRNYHVVETVPNVPVLFKVLHVKKVILFFVFVFLCILFFCIKKVCTNKEKIKLFL